MIENTLDSDVKTQQQQNINKNNKKNQLSKHNKAKSSHSTGPTTLVQRNRWPKYRLFRPEVRPGLWCSPGPWLPFWGHCQ